MAGSPLHPSKLQILSIQTPKRGLYMSLGRGHACMHANGAATCCLPRVDTTTALANSSKPARMASQKDTPCLARPRPAPPCPSPRRQLSPSRARCPSGSRADPQHLCGPMPGAAMAWPSSWLVSTIHFGRASAAVGRHARYFDGREERAERTREGARQPTHMPTDAHALATRTRRGSHRRAHCRCAQDKTTASRRR